MKSKLMAKEVSRLQRQRREEKNYFSLLSCVLDHNSEITDLKDEVLGLLRSKSYGKLLELADSLSKTVYPTAAKHFAANQLSALILKYPFPGPIPGVDPEKKALDKFASAEKLCKGYNKVWRYRRKFGKSMLHGGPASQRRASFNRILARSKEWVWNVIGEEPDFKAIWSKCDFGPGASVGVSGNATHMASKFLAPCWSVTPSALPYALAALRSNPQVMELLCKKEGTPFYSVDPELFERELLRRVQYVTYNKIALVPKTSLVHRTIAVEPLLNGFVQKGIDLYLRGRLNRFGIDLKDQSKNQVLARMGSLPDSDPFATIDLSMASDLISLELAKELLPPAWFSLLNATRSHQYKLNGRIETYHKFVSMGNGFCFPLETLIFASVCAAVYGVSNLQADFSVYGDDIIVRQSVATEVLNHLRSFGFRHNPDKTFAKGPFRESCGADWYLGEDVRPVMLDDTLGSYRSIIGFHNGTLRNERASQFFQEARVLLRALVPPKKRFMRPYKGDMDTAFEVERDTFMGCPFAVWNRETWSWQWKEYLTLSVDDSADFREKHGWSTVLMMAALRGSSSKEPFTKRRNTRTRVRKVSHHGGHSTWLPSPH